MEIISDVYLIDTGVSNCYLIVEPDGLSLIDAGTPFVYSRIAAFIRSVGREAKDLTHILLTHADIDHVGAAMALKRESGARIYASQIAADALAEGQSSRQVKMGVLTPFFDWFERRGDQMRVAVDETLSAGDTLPILGGLKVIETPGHTPGHLSFYAGDQKLLFAGDAVRTRNDRVGYNWVKFTNWDHDIMRQSAQKLARLQPEIVCCGHGPVVHGAASKFPV